MPILMNKGNDPYQAAWLFYTPRDLLQQIESAIAEGRFDSGVLTVDADQVAAAKKNGSEVPVYLEVKELVPEDFDIELAKGEIVEKAKRAALEAADAQAEAEDDAAAAPDERQPSAEASDGSEGNPKVSVEVEDTSADTSVDTSASTSADTATDLAESDGGEGEPEAEGVDATMDYIPVPAPQGIRIPMGTTTVQAARSFFLPAATDAENAAWDAKLPGLQMLGQLVGFMEQSGAGLPSWAIWHIDAGGILRMAPAKKVKPMAGNTLTVKL